MNYLQEQEVYSIWPAVFLHLTLLVVGDALPLPQVLSPWPYAFYFPILVSIVQSCGAFEQHALTRMLRNAVD
jgi:ABC-type anion transport system duplicated permease subunit